MDIDFKEALEKAQAVERLTLAQRVKNDLFFLNKHILGYDLMTEKTHRGLCLVAESLILEPAECLNRWNELKEPHFEMEGKDGEVFKNSFDINEFRKRFRMILMPRGAFKSSCVTVGFTLQNILHNPDIRILIDSETFDKSRAFVSEIRGHLESNERYREIFKILHGVYPDANKSSDKWTDSELNVPRKQKRKEPTISAAGVGVTKVGMHYDLIIPDDLHSEKNVTTKDAIDLVINHYKGLLSLLEPGGIMCVIGTRWDYNDVYQYIIDREKSRFLVYARQAIQPDSTLLFPERLTREFLEEQKISQGSSMFGMQYQNMPVDDENATFKASQMRRVSWELVKDKPINWFLMVDPAISQDKGADDTAFVTAGLDSQRNLYVRHILKGKFTPGEIVDQVFRLFQEFEHKAITVEAVAFQKTLQYALNDKMAERGWWLPIKEFKRKTTQSKEDRIRGLQPYYEYGHIFHLEDCPFVDDLEYELIHFPKGQHDDVIDALSDVLEIGFPPQGGKVNTERKKKDRQKLLKYLKPRSRITNY